MKRGKLFICLSIFAVVMFSGAHASAQVKVDPNLPEYKPVEGISGSIKSMGSDTLNNLMTLWSEGFRRMYPGVTVEIEGKGSGTAPVALISGTANFGPMSREMRGREIDEFEKQFGYKPTSLRTGIDLVGVFVHKDNPVEGLTLAQVDAIFSKDRRHGYKSDITNWGQVGLTGDWALPISMYGRNAASGTYGFFREICLGNGDYKDTVKEQPGSSAVIQGVASDRAGIGYSGIGYRTADVRPLSIAVDENAKMRQPAAEYAYTGEYPLARYLFIYINYKPGSDLDPLRREFIKYMMSRQGQEDVLKDGFFPITATIAKETLASVGIK